MQQNIYYILDAFWMIFWLLAIFLFIYQSWRKLSLVSMLSRIVVMAIMFACESKIGK